ncbi:hypothetical protein V7147_10625 [Bacillus sp. JJ1521]|uniref:hypothetical protein n=1 Tax=Bacillus sp. JJ1521 TaxID=3122957 RepID=UPI003000C45D
MQDDKEKLDKLYNQLQNIQTMLEKITKDGMVYFINIEKLDFQGPVLDSLEFIFDKIDVKEVSGALNLGNNLGVNVDGKNKNVKPSGIKIKEKNSKGKGEEQSKQATSPNDSKEYSELEEKLEQKLDEIFPERRKSKKIEEAHEKTKKDEERGSQAHSEQKKESVKSGSKNEIKNLADEIIIHSSTNIKLKE